MFSAVHPITDIAKIWHVRFVPCVDGSGLARAFFTSQAWSVLPCVRPIDAVHMTAYPGSIPDVVSKTQPMYHPHESTLSPQARRNLPSALRNPLERRRSAIPARSQRVTTSTVGLRDGGPEQRLSHCEHDLGLRPGSRSMKPKPCLRNGSPFPRRRSPPASIIQRRLGAPAAPAWTASEISSSIADSGAAGLTDHSRLFAWNIGISRSDA